MADRIAQPLLTGLSRAVAEPGGLPLLASRSTPGLFPATAVGRQAAQRGQDEGLLSAITNRAGQPAYSLTEKGLRHLVSNAAPRQLLDDFLRVLEARQSQAADLIAAANQIQASLEGLKVAVTALAAPPSPPADDDWAALCLEALRSWRGSGDCPLPELYRLATATTPLTVGQFHDGLRRLHETSRIYLHPWTGPLYDLPEPRFALLTGHLVAYYASQRG